jgi:hypothetical protein
MAELVERLLELHGALDAAAVPHAFGGAIALAYWTLEPRGTRDIDCNLFVPANRPEAALRALPAGIVQPPGVAEAIVADGQIRLWWGDVPVDVFFDYVDVHRLAARDVRLRPFAGVEIPVLDPIALAVFKAMFDRTKDWADIEAMVAAGSLDLAAAQERLVPMVGADDPRLARLRALADSAVSWP